MKNEKKIPKSVWFFVVLVGFLTGNLVGGLMLMFNVFVWGCINVVAVLTLWLLDWRFGEVIQDYIPRYKTEEKEEST